MKESHTSKGKNHWKRPFKISQARQRRTSKNSGKKVWLFLLPSFLGTGIFTVFPFLDVIKRSFTEAFSNRFVGMANYQTVFENEAFLLAVKNTLRFLGVCIPLLIVSSLVLALAIQKMGEKKKVFQGAFLIPMAVPIASVVLFWKLLFDKNGFLNGWLQIFSIAPVDWMNEKTAFAVLVFSYLWKNMGYFIVLWLAGLNGIPATYYEAARVDGASDWKCFFYITLPQLVSSFTMITILAFVNSFKVFREAYLIAGDYPHESIYMLQHLFNNWFVSLDIQKMSTAAVVLAVFIAVLIGVFLVLEKRLEMRSRE
ncbi:MAG: sugar ABC transporter permease [Lachnospiraceae bacterium]|nr:sugar ABC transporter permease [Lachnospiraceae bacterium]